MDRMPDLLGANKVSAQPTDAAGRVMTMPTIKSSYSIKPGTVRFWFDDGTFVECSSEQFALHGILLKEMPVKIERIEEVPPEKITLSAGQLKTPAKQREPFWLPFDRRRKVKR